MDAMETTQKPFRTKGPPGCWESWRRTPQGQTLVGVPATSPEVKPTARVGLHTGSGQHSSRKAQPVRANLELSEGPSRLQGSLCSWPRTSDTASQLKCPGRPAPPFTGGDTALANGALHPSLPPLRWLPG